MTDAPSAEAAAAPMPPAAAGRTLGGRDLLVQVLLYAPSSLIPAVLALAFTAVFTRRFSTSEFGHYSLAMSAASFLAAVGTQWLQQGVTRFLPGNRSVEDVARLRGAAALGLVVVAALVVLLGAGAFAAAWLIGGAAWAAWVIPTTAAALATAHFSALVAVLQAGMRAGRYSAYRLLEAGIRFGAALLLVLVLHQAAVSLVWAAVLSIAVLLPLLWRDAGLPSQRAVLAEARRHLPALRKLASYGLPMVGWYLAAMFLDVGDRYLIQFFRGSAEVGLYAANYTLVYGAVGLLAAPMLLAAHPFLMRAWGEGHPAEAAAWLGRIAEWFIVMGVLLTGGVWLVARDLTTIFLGPSFRAGWVILTPVLGGLVAWQLGMYTHKPLEYAGRTRTMFLAAVGVAVTKMALNALLLPFFGYVAAAWTTLGAYVFYAALTYRLGVRELRWRIDHRRIAWVVALTVVALAIGAGLGVYVEQRAGGPVAFVFRMVWAALLAGTVLQREWRFARAPKVSG